MNCDGVLRRVDWYIDSHIPVILRGVGVLSSTILRFARVASEPGMVSFAKLEFGVERSALTMTMAFHEERNLTILRT